MAQGGVPLETREPARPYEDEVPTLNKFLETPTWLYPIIRYLGHALLSERTIDMFVLLLFHLYMHCMQRCA